MQCSPPRHVQLGCVSLITHDEACPGSLVCEFSVPLPAEGRGILVCGHEIEQRRAWAIQQRLPKEGAAHELCLLQDMPRLQP